MGDNGILKQASNAKNKTEEAQKNETEYLSNASDYIDKYLAEITGSNDTDKISKINKLNLDEAIDKKNFDASGNIVDSLNYAITGWIDVENADIVTFQGLNVKRIIVGMRYVIAYNVNKDIISIKQNLNSYLVEENVKYIRIAFPTRYYDISTEPMVVFTDDIVDYEPYNLSTVKEVDKICDTYSVTSEYIGSYPHESVNDVYNLYDELVDKYPEYVSKTVLGQADNKDICRYDFNPAQSQNSNDICKILYCSGTHGAERPNIIVGFRFCKDLCENWESSELLKDLRNNVHFTVVPIVNPYGFVTGTRKNENGVDINRNFTNGWKAVDDENSLYYSGPSPASEISTQLIEKICNEERFDFGLDHHIFDYFSASEKMGYFVNSTERPLDVSVGNMLSVWINKKLLKSNSNIADSSKSYFYTINQGDCGGYLFGAFKNGMLFESMIDWGDSKYGTSETAQKLNVEVLGAIFETAKNEYRMQNNK